MHFVRQLVLVLIVGGIHFCTAANVLSQQWLHKLDLITISEPRQWNNLICFAGSARNENVTRIFFY